MISVHGRTRHQTSAGTPVSLKDIRFANEIAAGAVPVVANGDVFSLADAQKTREVCKVNGVMSARGLLANPVLFHSTLCLSLIFVVLDRLCSLATRRHLLKRSK